MISLTVAVCVQSPLTGKQTALTESAVYLCGLLSQAVDGTH